MSIYNYFGLQYGDIVSAFNGSIIEDFATNNRCGSKIILDEMQIKESQVVAHFSVGLNAMLNEIPDHWVSSVELSGVSAFVFDFTPDFTEPIRVKVFNRCSTNFDECITLCSGYETITTAVVSGKTYGLLNRIIAPNERILLRYRADKNLLEMPSLKGVLRDGVCCTLGNVLYSDGENKWGAVENFCTNWGQWLDLLKYGWIPPELKSLDLYNYIGSFRGVRDGRFAGGSTNNLWRGIP
jgi:hypothetical protein